MNANIAKPYANAIFTLAKQENKLEEWLTILKIINNAVNNINFQQLIYSPRFSKEKFIASIVVSLSNDFNSYITNLLSILFDAKKLNILHNIFILFEKKLNEHSNILPITIYSAYPIDETTQIKLNQSLSIKFKKKINSIILIDDALIAGIKIVTNETVLDLSLKGKLNQMLKQLI